MSKQKGIIVILVVLLGTIAFLAGFSVEKRPVDFNENFQDCISRGGKYLMSYEEGDDWNYESCVIEKRIKY